MEADKYYHIFNRTNNKEFLFKEEENYRFFLEQVKKYIVPIADIFSYCLMPNHFHFVLRIKGDNKLKVFVEKCSKINQIKDLQGFENLEGLTSKFISQQFSNLFNSYTKAINKKYNRKGSLFTPRFKRKEIPKST
jgi:REP element-mobilizing transposase RayT